MNKKTLVTLLFLLQACVLFGKESSVRQQINLNRDWHFTLGDPEGVQQFSFSDKDWQQVNLPHSFSLPYFMWKSVYNGYGWYRKTIDMPTDWKGKQVFIEFEGIFIQSEVYLNGQRVGEHTGGYTGFCYDLTPFLKVGKNMLAVRVNNLWKPDVAPRAGDHQFSGGIYRDVYLHVTDPLHVAWCGTFVSTPEVSKSSASFQVETEVKNDNARSQQFLVKTEIISPKGKVVSQVESKEALTAGESRIFTQHPAAIANPSLWHPDSPELYKAVTTICQGTKVVDQVETTFGIRWFEWTADKGFFINGEHYYLLGANVHQDHAGWGDAVANAGFRRDIQMMKDCGFNTIRGSHYPHDPSFAQACDEIGILFFPENAFWGMGGGSGDRDGWGTPSSGCYPPNPEHQDHFDQSVLSQLKELIRINRNSPSITAWSMSNEPFFTDASTDERMKALLNKATDSTLVWDPTRLVAIGGSQRKGVDKLGKNQIAFYNGDGAGFLNPGVPNMVSEYSSVTTHRPGTFEPGWADLKDGFDRPEWRGGQVIWCGFDHGTVGGTGLAIMGLVDYFRIPKRSWYWYQEVYAKGNRNPVEPEWPAKGVPAKIGLSADKTTLAAPDGTDDAHILITLLDANGKPLCNEVPVKLSVLSGPGEFPTGTSIQFLPPSEEEASDITIRDGKAAIEFRSYYAGTTVIEASAEGLPSSTITIRTLGQPTWESAGCPKVADRPYKRYIAPKKEEPVNELLLAVNRPSFVSSTAELSSRALSNDGDEQTAWFAAPSDKAAWWKLDLEASYDLNAIEVVFPTADTHQYIIEVSSDNQSWTTVSDQRSNDKKKKKLSVNDVQKKNIRFVRISFVSGNAGLAEVKVGGKPTSF